MASAEVISRQADGHRQADGRDRQPTEQSRSPLLSLAMFAVDGSVAATKEALEQNGGDVMIVGHLPFSVNSSPCSSQAAKKMKSWSFDLAA